MHEVRQTMARWAGALLLLGMLASTTAGCSGGSGGGGSRLDVTVTSTVQFLVWGETDRVGGGPTRIMARELGATGAPVQIVALDPGVKVLALVHDPRTDTLYWGEENLANPAPIMQVGFDGSGLRPFLIGAPDTVYEGIALDLDLDQIYYTSRLTSSLAFDFVGRVDLDGTDEITLIFTSPNDNPRGMTIDFAGGKLIGVVDAAVVIADLDGANVTPIAGAFTPREIVLHKADRRVLWSELSATGLPGGQNGRIRSVNLDGSGFTDLLTGLDDPVGLALDEDRGAIYYATSDDLGKVFEVDLVSGAETLLFQANKSITTLELVSRVVSSK